MPEDNAPTNFISVALFRLSTPRGKYGDVAHIFNLSVSVEIFSFRDDFLCSRSSLYPPLSQEVWLRLCRAVQYVCFMFRVPCAPTGHHAPRITHHASRITTAAPGPSLIAPLP